MAMLNGTIPAAVLQHLDQGVVVLDAVGEVVCASPAARAAFGVRDGLRVRPADLRAEAARRGAREIPLSGNGVAAGVAFVLPLTPGSSTLAEQERAAILKALAATNGRLAETARRLGISRTTLWRRLKAYGAPDPHRGLPLP